MAIFLIPSPIAEERIETIPPQTIKKLHSISHFIVERAKTARHFIKSTFHPIPIQEIDIFEIDKHHPENGLFEYLKGIAFSHDIGIISEAGCPGVADPGARIVAWAHKQKIKVFPLVGPSSILLALMSSGFTGQKFSFHGYLPQQKGDLIKILRQLERESDKNKTTQIFIETPYRNKNMIKICCGCLKPLTLMSIAMDITGVNENIKTLTIEEWRKTNLESYHKKPAVYLIGRI